MTSPAADDAAQDRDAQAAEGGAARKNDRWIATVSVVASLVVAVATVIGSLWTVSNTSRDQANQSRNDFIRQQRQLAYSEASSSLLKFSGSITGCDLKARFDLENVYPLDDKASDSILSDVSANQAAVEDSLGSLEVLGSTAVRDEEAKLQTKVLAVLADCIDVMGIALNPRASITLFSQHIAAFEHASLELDTARSEFLDLARKDIQT